MSTRIEFLINAIESQTPKNYSRASSNKPIHMRTLLGRQSAVRPVVAYVNR